jgi:uncharacterized protein (TIGR02117 family)
VTATKASLIAIQARPTSRGFPFAQPTIRRGILTCALIIAARAFAMASWECAVAEPNCQSVFVVHSAWHAALVLQKSTIPFGAIPELVDFPQGRFIEFSWGDNDYFPNPDAGIFSALKAAFFSSGSVLHLVGFNADVKIFYPDAEVIELRLSAPAYAGLVDYISQTFLRSATGGRAQAGAGLFPYSRFYPATRKFSLLRTCNAWVAEALESAGLPIGSSYVVTAGQLAEQLGKITERQ